MHIKPVKTFEHFATAAGGDWQEQGRLCTQNKTVFTPSTGCDYPRWLLPILFRRHAQPSFVITLVTDCVAPHPKVRQDYCAASHRLHHTSRHIHCCPAGPSSSSYSSKLQMLCRQVASLQRTALLQAPLRFPAATMCGSLKSGTAAATTYAETPLAKGQYAKELETACLAVQLASKLCRTVQQQLKSSETAGKQDDSPVTVADYGAHQHAVQCTPAVQLQLAHLP